MPIRGTIKIEGTAGQATDQATKRFASMNLFMQIIVLAMSAGGIGFAIAYIFGIIPMQSTQYYFLLMAMYLPLVYLLMPASAAEKKISWFNYVLAAIAFITTFFMSTQAMTLLYQGWIPPTKWWQLVIAITLLLLVLEAARRSGGPIYLVVVVLFAFYPAFAHKMPGMFWGPSFPLTRTLGYSAFSSEALLGIPTRITGETLIGFLIFAALIIATGVADFFLKLAMSLMGGVRGGTAKVAVLSSGFMGSLSGSIFSNVVGTGSVTIPAMKRSGIKDYYAAACEACASTGGMLMPPVMGAVAFIMADFTAISYAHIAVAAAIPSILYYFGIYCHVDSYAHKKKLSALSKEEVPSLINTLKEGWPFLTVLLALIYFLVFMRFERLAPFYASVLLIVITTFKKEIRLNTQKIVNILFQCGKILSQTLALLMPASLITGGLLGTGVAPSITSHLIRIGESNVALVLLIGVGICILLGMAGMLTASYLLLALTLAPALESLAGLNTLAVHLFIAYYAMLSAITPPVAMAAFIASRIAGSSPMLTSVTSARLAFVLYLLPFAFLFEPALILEGPIYLTIIWIIIAIIGTLLVAGGSEGYLYRFGEIESWARPFLFIAGALIFFPQWESTVIGVIIAAVVLLILRFLKNKNALPKYGVPSSTE